MHLSAIAVGAAFAGTVRGAAMPGYDPEQKPYEKPAYKPEVSSTIEAYYPKPDPTTVSCPSPFSDSFSPFTGLRSNWLQHWHRSLRANAV